MPTNYERYATLNLAKNRLAAIGMMVAATCLLAPIAWLLLRFLAATRPGEGTFAGGAFSLDVLGALFFLVAFVALIGAVALAHEAAHGLAFWVFTGRRPQFGFRFIYAFAAAPECYVPWGRYLVVGLAPLIVITAAGLALLLMVPAPAIPVTILIITFNAAGAVGDLAVVAWLLTRPRTSLVLDTGDAVTIYQPAKRDDALAA